MLPNTATIREIAVSLRKSPVTVARWVGRGKWPDGHPIRRLKLSDQRSADWLVLEDDYLKYFRRCAERAGGLSEQDLNAIFCEGRARRRSAALERQIEAEAFQRAEQRATLQGGRGPGRTIGAINRILHQ